MAQRKPRIPLVKTLPRSVQEERDFILYDVDHDFFDIARRLIPCDSPEDSQDGDALGTEQPALLEMWVTLEKYEMKNPRFHEISEDCWVYIFLEKVASAMDFPRAHDKNTADRLELSDSISKLSSELANLLRRNELDCHIVHLPGPIFKGFMVYEDLVQKRQDRIDSQGMIKVKFSEMLNVIAGRAKDIIAEAPTSGKFGTNAAARRFARIINDHNINRYGSPLFHVTATATNALYGTNYVKGDIHALVKSQM
ncbi:hypothetical protein [Geomonas agri]|uniref:hypothetical protein n=1 Tax=Geomonas agri TaxID=2873702 RepID=UPI001CD45195|nr:hypothetical protein [Geomonas agri]